MRVVVRADPEVVAGSASPTTLPGLSRFSGSKARLIGLEGRVDLGAEELAIPEAAGQAVAVLAAHRAAELDDQVGDLAGDRPQRLDALPAS